MTAATPVAPTRTAARDGLALDGRSLRKCVDGLPVLPQALLEALTALRDENSRVDDCAESIARDPALAARTLRLANSAFYGVTGKVATLRDAVHMLGRSTLGGMLTTAAVSAQFAPGRCAGLDFARFWRHGLGCAIGARTLARELRLDEEVAFMAGLLHDIGHLVMAVHFPIEMARVLAHARQADVTLLEAEQATLATDHTQLGGMVAAHWHFPDTIVQAILHHHGPVGDSASQASIGDCVHVADAIAHALDLSAAEDELVPDIDAAAWDRMGLSTCQYLFVFEQTCQGVAQMCEALAL